MSEDRYDRASGINAQFTEREKTVKMGREPVADNARLRSGTPTADDLWTALADLLSANADGKDAEVYWSALQRARDVRDRYRRAIEVASPSKRVERLETALKESRQWLQIVADEYEKASGEPQHIADTIARIDQALQGGRS